MKRALQKCFLVIMCLTGSEILAQGYDDLQTSGTGLAEPVVIYGEIRSDSPPDSLSLIHWGTFLDRNMEVLQPEVVHTVVRPGTMLEGVAPGRDFIFRLELPDIRDLGYISIYEGMKPLLDMYIIQPGDSVRIRMDLEKGMVLFDGKSAPSFQVQYALKVENERQLFAVNPRFSTPEINRFLARPGYDSLLQLAKKSYGRYLQVVDRDADTRVYLQEVLAKQVEDDPALMLLDSNREKLSEPIYQLLRADVLGEFYFAKYYSYYGSAHLFAHWDKNSSLKSYLMDIYEDQIACIGIPEVPLMYQVRSKGYLDYALGKIYATSAGTRTDPIVLLSEMPASVLRDKILVKHLTKSVKNPGKASEIILAFRDEVMDEDMGSILDTYSQKAQLYQPLPNVRLWDTTGLPYDTDSLRGKVTLVDFWFTGCKACIDMYTNHLTKIKERYKDNPDFQMVSVSADKSTEIWLKSIRSGKYTSEKALNLQTKGYDHPLLHYLGVTGYPRIIFMDRKGKLVPIEGDLDAESMIRQIDRLIYH